MAFLDYTENFWFPSQTGTYTLPSGDTLRICIYYDRASADANTDTDAELEKLTPLDIPLEVSSSAQSHRFSSIQFSFINIDNVFETESILLDAKKNETFCDIYFNGSLYWRGLVEFNQTKKDKWYIDSGSLKYRIIKVKAYDVMSYFWKNAKTLNDASYANAQSIKTVLEGVLGLAGFAAGNLNIDTSIDINELCGTSYDLSTLKCNGFGTSMLCSTFLKSFMLYFGAFIFHLKGKMNIVSRVAGTTVSVGNDDIVKLKNIENKNAIEYISVTCYKDFQAQVSDITDVTATEIYGDSDYPNNRKYILDGVGFLDYIYSTPGGVATYPTAPGAHPQETANYYIEWSSSYNLYTNNIETGMRAIYPSYHNTIIDVPGNRRINMPTGAAQAPTDQNAYVNRDSHNNYKMVILVETTAAVLNQYFRTSKDILKLIIADITDFDDLTKRFTVLSNNHRAKNSKINFTKDEITVDLVQVT